MSPDLFPPTLHNATGAPLLATLDAMTIAAVPAGSAGRAAAFVPQGADGTGAVDGAGGADGADAAARASAAFGAANLAGGAAAPGAMKSTLRADAVGAEPALTGVLLQTASQPDLRLRAQLVHDGVRWLHAASVDAALAMLHAPDGVALACVDAGGGADGWALAVQLQDGAGAHCPPVIVVSDAGPDQASGLRAAGQGGNLELLVRPLAPGLLQRRSAQLVQMHRERVALARERQACAEAMRLHALFADVLGHDLRSPLSAILMSAEVLKRRPDDALQKTGARLARSASWMARMIQDMLDLTRARLGLPLLLQPQPLALLPLLQAMLDERARAHPDNPLRTVQHGDLHGRWDGTRLLQMVSSLVGNALQHGEPGQPVDLLFDGRDADAVCIEVRNHGAIDAALLPQVFDPLHAGRRPSAPEGLGFGLFIAREIARAHGGTLSLQSDPRHGTRVQVMLPRAFPALQAPAGPGDTAGAGGTGRAAAPA